MEIDQKLTKILEIIGEEGVLTIADHPRELQALVRRLNAETTRRHEAGFAWLLATVLLASGCALFVPPEVVVENKPPEITVPPAPQCTCTCLAPSSQPDKREIEVVPTPAQP